MKDEFDLDRMMEQQKRIPESEAEINRLLYENMRKVADMQDGLDVIEKAYIAGRLDGMMDVRTLGRQTA